ncbi:polyprenyl synthetase family protein [Akkermansia muciniphila]|nr:polyprenyl synthetase family protein [Akkermansia muciniphila]
MSIPFFSKLRSQKHYLQLVKPELKQVSEFVEAQSSCFDPEVADYMETVCQSKGKMLRPALVLLVAGATGGIKPAHIRLGALLEMVHLASLVHDDVIDEADKRRDEATANALWGNSLAVLLGMSSFPTPWCWVRNSAVRNSAAGWRIPSGTYARGGGPVQPPV